jgi:hypothetical protein
MCVYVRSKQERIMSDESSEHNKKNTKGEYNFMENVGVALAASPIGQSPIGDAVRKAKITRIRSRPLEDIFKLTAYIPI